MRPAGNGPPARREEARLERGKLRKATPLRWPGVREHMDAAERHLRQAGKKSARMRSVAEAGASRSLERRAKLGEGAAAGEAHPEPQREDALEQMDRRCAHAGGSPSQWTGRQHCYALSLLGVTSQVGTVQRWTGRVSVGAAHMKNGDRVGGYRLENLYHERDLRKYRAPVAGGSAGAEHRHSVQESSLR